MAKGDDHDADAHELARRFPEAVLALFGLQPRGRYRVDSIEVKATKRRADLVFMPEDPLEPRFYLEWQATPEETVERRLLEEVVVHCAQLASYSPVVAAIVYTSPSVRAAALPADVSSGSSSVVRFSPLRVVLSEVEPETLLARGGGCLVALPLVGPQERVAADANQWLGQVRQHGSSADTELFLRLLAWRLGKMNVLALLKGQEDLVKDTATGRALLAEGEARGEARGVEKERRRAILLVLTTRLGTLPAWVTHRLEQEHDLQRLDTILTSALAVDDEAELEALFAR